MKLIKPCCEGLMLQALAQPGDIWGPHLQAPSPPSLPFSFLPLYSGPEAQQAQLTEVAALGPVTRLTISTILGPEPVTQKHFN